MRTALVAGALFAVGLLAWAACSCAPDGAVSRHNVVPPPDSAVGLGYDTPFLVEGIRQPPTLPADEARVDEQAGVIGVSAGGRYRAYLTRAFEDASSHVVNDLVGDVPVSVTHCDQTRSTRVFTTDKRGTVIELMTGGWENNEMSLRLNDVHYAQTSAEIPLADVPFEATTWGEWKAAHPDTDVYVGEGDAPPR